MTYETFMFEAMSIYLKNLLEQRGREIRDLIQPDMSRPKVSRILNGHQIPMLADRKMISERLGINFEAFDAEVSECIKRDQMAEKPRNQKRKKPSSHAASAIIDAPRLRPSSESGASRRGRPRK